MAQKTGSSAVFPSITQPFVQADDLVVTMPWRQWLQTVWRRVGGGGGSPMQNLVLGPSPFTFTASVPGTLYVQGGSGVSLGLSRPNGGGVGFAGSAFMSQGDSVEIVYGSAPTVVFVPV